MKFYRSRLLLLVIGFVTLPKNEKPRRKLWKAVSNLDESSGKGSKKAKDNINVAPSKDTDSLEAELANLREELKYQCLRADAYSEMINVAEKQFNIKIRKKVGAKQ